MPSSRHIARCRAFGPAPPSAHGCSASSATRRATGGARPAVGRLWSCVWRKAWARAVRPHRPKPRPRRRRSARRSSVRWAASATTTAWSSAAATSCSSRSRRRPRRWAYPKARSSHAWRGRWRDFTSSWSRFAMAELQRLESGLADLASALVWPATPDLRAGVRAGIIEARRRRRRQLRLLLIAAVVAVAVIGGAAAAAYIELRGASIQTVPVLPSPSPTRPGPIGVRLDLGDRYSSLGAAEQAAGFNALVPSALGQPDEIYFRRSPDVLTLVYKPRPNLPATSDPDVGALVMEARASVGQESFAKIAGPDGKLQPVTVNGGSGFWISGAPHGFFFYTGATGRPDQFRLAGDVLIWNQGGLVVRIESALDESKALAVAGTMR